MKFVQPIRNLDKIEEVKEFLKNGNIRNYIIFMIGINLGRRISDSVNLKAGQLRDRDRLIIKERKTERENNR